MSAVDVAVAVMVTVFLSAFGVWLVDRLDWHRPWCSCGSCDYRARLRKTRRREKRLDRYFRDLAKTQDMFTLADAFARWRGRS